MSAERPRLAAWRALNRMLRRMVRTLPEYAGAATSLMMGTRRARAVGLRLSARDQVAAWIRG